MWRAKCILRFLRCLAFFVSTRTVNRPEPGTSSSRNLLFFELERFGINFSSTGTDTGIPKSQINFIHERFFAVNCTVLK